MEMAGVALEVAHVDGDVNGNEDGGVNGDEDGKEAGIRKGSSKIKNGMVAAAIVVSAAILYMALKSMASGLNSIGTRILVHSQSVDKFIDNVIESRVELQQSELQRKFSLRNGIVCQLWHKAPMTVNGQWEYTDKIDKRIVFPRVSDHNEYIKLVSRTALGFLVMGFVGFL